MNISIVTWFGPGLCPEIYGFHFVMFHSWTSRHVKTVYFVEIRFVHKLVGMKSGKETSMRSLTDMLLSSCSMIDLPSRSRNCRRCRRSRDRRTRRTNQFRGPRPSIETQIPSMSSTWKSGEKNMFSLMDSRKDFASCYLFGNWWKLLTLIMRNS